MAISLYDRCVDGDSMISDDGCRINRVAVRAIRDILAVAEVDGAVDLRDLSTVIKGSVDDVILNEIIRRRLSAKPLRGERGTQGGDKLPATMDDDYNIKWICVSQGGSGATEPCVYNDEQDPMHDECVYCGQPQERK
jgi:hypothetical protein